MKLFSLLSSALTARTFLIPMAATLPLLTEAAGASLSPAIILVPGAFHQETVFGEVVELLHEAQYPKTYAIDLPSVGAMRGRDEDVALVRQIMNRELEKGRNVLLVGNSYGGTVIGEAVKGLQTDAVTASSRIRRDAAGRGRKRARGKILGLVFLSGFLPYISDVEFPETKPDVRTISPSYFRFTEDGKVYPDGDPAFPPSLTFYNELSPEDAQYWTSQLQYSSFEAIAANATYIPYTGDFRSLYVIGTKDNAVPEAFAQSYIQQPGAQFEVEYIDADHVPMLSNPEETVNIIRRAAGESI